MSVYKFSFLLSYLQNYGVTKYSNHYLFLKNMLFVLRYLRLYEVFLKGIFPLWSNSHNLKDKLKPHPYIITRFFPHYIFLSFQRLTAVTSLPIDYKLFVIYPKHTTL